MLDTAGPSGLPSGPEGRKPGEPATIGGNIDLVKSAKGVGIRIQGEQVGEFCAFLKASIAMGKPLRKRAGKDLQGLRGGQDDTPVVAVIAQVIGDGDRQGDFHAADGPGKVFHSCTVLASIATGLPLAVRAQCRVNPRQISAPVSAWVMM